MPLGKGLPSSHKALHIEWTCLDPACVDHENGNEGHVVPTMLKHEQEDHPTEHSSIMVGMIPCPVSGCHFVFPFTDDLWHHMKVEHKGVPPHGLAQAMMVLLPTNKAILQTLHAAYEIPGHGARRSLSEHEKPDKYTTHRSSHKAHPRFNNEPHPINVPRISHGHAQIPGASHYASENDERDPEEEPCLLDVSTLSGHTGHTGWEPPVVTRDPTFHDGTEVGAHEESLHPGLYAPEQRLSHEHNQDHYLGGGGKRRPPAAHNFHQFPKCKTDGAVDEMGMLHHIETTPNHQTGFSCWHCGRMFGNCNKSLLMHVHQKHAKVEFDEKLPCRSAGCTQTCHNSWHQRQHLIIDHHDKAAQQDPPTFRYPGTEDHDKSHGHGGGQDHSKGGKIDGHEKDSYGHEKDGGHHSKAEGEAKDSHGHEKGKDHDKHNEHDKGSRDHENGKDHAMSDAHEKASQEHAKDNSHAKEDHGHAMGKDHNKYKDHAKEQDHSKAQEPHNHAKAQDHGKEDHAKGKDHTKEKDHSKGHEHVEDEWTDDEKSGKQKAKVKSIQKDKRPIVIPKRKIGTKAKKSISFRTGFSEAKKKL